MRVRNILNTLRMNTSGSTPRPHGNSNVANTHDNDDHVKIERPNKYYGQRDKFENWLMQMELFFGFQRGNIPNHKRVIFAVTYMRDKVLKWVKFFVKIYMKGSNENNYEEVQEWIKSFPKFKDKINRVFGPSNENNVAIRIIQHLQQRKSAAEYATQFQQHAENTDWDDNAFMTMFRRKLKNNVKNELMRSGAFIENFEKLIEQTIEIDDKLYERAMEKRHDGSGFGSHKYGYGNSGFSSNKSTSRPAPDPYGPMPMELDFMRKKKQQPKGSRKQHKGFKKALKCYGCGKPGHIAKNCRSKNMVYRFQLNVMQRVSTEGLNSGDNSPVFDEDDFNQFLTESGSIEDKIRSRLKQESDNEDDVESQDTVETIRELIQHTDRMLKNSTRRINRFNEAQVGSSAEA